MQKLIAKMAAPERLHALAREFRRAPAAFRPLPFWFWNGDPTGKKDIRAQIIAMRKQDIMAVMPMPIYGLDLPYGQDEWYAMMRHAADVCAEQKMQLWIYDEFHCPSGACGGRVLQEHPEYNRTALLHNAFAVRAGARFTIQLRPAWLTRPEFERRGEELFADAPPRVFREQAGRVAAVDDFELDVVPAPVGSRRAPGNVYRLHWRNRGAREVTLHFFTLVRAQMPMAFSFGTHWATHQGGYLDVLNPQAVAAFLRRTFNGYDSRLADYYGKVVAGVFTDEPGLAYGFHGKAGASLPYTPELFALFEKTYGYDLAGRLVELAVDIGDFRRTRVDYWSLVSRLFAENFSRQYARWCARRNLIYTGHFAGEETLQGSAAMNGDLFTAARHMHVPGLDILRTETPYDPPPPRARTGRETDGERQALGHIIAAKVLVSTARAAGARRVLCEANGVSNWSVTLGDLKHLADWLCAMGVTLINDNGIPFSVKDIRGMAGRSMSAPWWPWYRLYAKRVGRLALVMSAGRSPARVAVLYPTTATWAALARNGGADPAAAPTDSAARFTQTQRTLMLAVKRLALDNCEFEFMFEEALRTAAVHNGELRAGDCRCRTLVLPDVDVMDAAAFRVMMKFRRAGGRIIVIGPSPRYRAGGGATRAIPARAWRRPNILRLPGMDTPNWADRLTAALAVLAPARVQVRSDQPDKLQVARRELRDGQAVLIINHAQTAAGIAVVRPPAGACAEWNPDTGAIRPFSGEIQNGGPIFRLEPWESKLLVFRPGRPASRIPAAHFPAEVVETRIAGPWQFEPQSDNLLPLAPRIALDFADAGLARGWAAGGSAAPWEKLSNDRARLALAPDLMAAYWLRADLTVAGKPGRLLLYQDGGTDCRLFVNGRAVAPLGRRQLWDPVNLCFDLAPLVRPGRNRLVLRVAPSPFLSQQIGRGRETGMLKGFYPMPAVLAGDFVVTGAGRIRQWRLPCPLRDGSWTEQGFPAFAGRGRYKAVFHWRLPKTRAWVKLSAMRDLAEVRVNGKNCGVRPWTPYLFEITPSLRRGANQLEIDVVNTFGNVLRRHYFGYDITNTPAGLLGGCRLLREK